MREDALLHSRDEDIRELKPLGGVKRHQDNAVGLGVVAIDVGDERDVLQKISEIGLGIVIGEVLGAFQETLDVFAALEKIVLPVLQFELSCEVREALDFLDGGGDGGGWCIQKLPKPTGEPPEPFGLLAASLKRVSEILRSGIGDNGLVGECGGILKFRKRFAAKPFADREIGEDALQGDGIAGVDLDAQQREEVLDFLAFVEPNPAQELIWDACLDEGLFEDARLGVGAVEDRAVAPGVPILVETSGFADNPLGLVAVGVGEDLGDESSVGVLGEEFFGDAARVVLDDGIGGVKDGRRGTVVLLEFD